MRIIRQSHQSRCKVSHTYHVAHIQYMIENINPTEQMNSIPTVHKPKMKSSPVHRQYTIPIVFNRRIVGTTEHILCSLSYTVSLCQKYNLGEDESV